MDSKKFSDIKIDKEDFEHLEIKYTMNKYAKPSDNSQRTSKN